MKTTYLIPILILSSLASCKRDYATDDTKNTSAKKLVETVKIANLENSEIVLASGRVASKEEVILSFKTGGIVRAMKAEEGQTAAKGKQLARLDLQEINAQLAAAKFDFEKSERDAERARLLYQDTVGTLENYQNAETRKALAKSQYDIVQFNRRYSIITMPITGTILEKYVEEGELVNPGQAIYKIGSTGRKGSKIIQLGLSEKDIVKIKKGDKGEVRFDAISDRNFPVTVTEISEAANSQTGVYDVEATFTDKGPQLKNGFIGKVSLFPSQNSSGLKIPINALVEGSDRTAVIYYSLDNSTVNRKEVDVLIIRKDYFTISQNSIPPKASVVVKGAVYLRDKDSISIK